MIQLFKGIRATPTQRLVAYMLADAHNEHTERCDPSLAFLIELTDLSERAVRDAIHGLEDAGHLTIVHRPGTRNAYLLHPPAPAPAPAPVAGHPGARCRTAPPAGGRQWPDSPAPVAGPPRHELPETPAPVAAEPEGTGHQPERNQKTGGGGGKGGSGGLSQPKGKADWRAFNQAEAGKANACPLPLLAPPEFSFAWSLWCQYRTRRATEARISSESLAWTVPAAEAELRNCERAALVHGWPAVSGRIDTAISGHWQGLNLDRLPAAAGTAHAPRLPASGPVRPERDLRDLGEALRDHGLVTR